MTSGRRHFIRSSIFISAGLFFENICGMILGLFVARWMGPRTQGIWQTARLFRTYSEFATLGQGLGMRREAAVAQGRGDGVEFEDQRDTGFTWATFSLGLAGLLIAVYALLMPHSGPFRLALATVALSVMMSGALSFFNLWYKTIERFGVLAGASIAAGVVSLGSIGLLKWRGFEGMLLGYVLTGFVALLVMVVAFRGPLRIRFSVEAWRRSLSVGFPLFLVTVAGILFSTLDRLLVVAVLGFADMGFYSVSSMCFMPVSMAVSSVSVVLLPRVCRHYGQTGTSEQMSQFLAEPLRLLMTPLAGVAGVAALMIPWLVTILLPGYEAGVVPAQIVLLGLPFGCVTGFFENVLVASGLTWRMALVTTLASVAKLVLVLALLVCGMGLQGVALGSVLASVVGFALLLAVAGRATGMAWKPRVVLLLESLAATGLSAAVVFYLRDFRALLSSPAKSAIPWIACTALVVLPACIVLRRWGRSSGASRI